MYTFEECYKNGPYRHYTIKWNGQVQPFGALFYNSRGDVKSYVEKAVKALNKAEEEGLTIVEIKQPKRKSFDGDRWFIATIGKGLEKVTQIY